MLGRRSRPASARARACARRGLPTPNRPPAPTNPRARRPPPAARAPPQTEWRPFDADAYNQPWSVPWGPGAVAGTMAAWVATFVGTAFLAAPALYVGVTKTPLWEMGPAQQADFALCSELLELAATAGLLWFVTSR